MKIAVLQGSSQKEKNKILFNAVQQAAPNAKVINFGVFEDEQDELTYVEASFLVGLLLDSGAVDFVVTGCSSGQGMMLACNAWPGVCCGYTPTPQDAFLFGRINGGNAVSLPLGLGFGWCGELNLQYTLQALFGGDFGFGYPAKDSLRKQKDTMLLKEISNNNKKSMACIIRDMDKAFLAKSLTRKNVIEYVLKNSKNIELIDALR